MRRKRPSTDIAAQLPDCHAELWPVDERESLMRPALLGSAVLVAAACSGIVEQTPRGADVAGGTGAKGGAGGSVDASGSVNVSGSAPVGEGDGGAGLESGGKSAGGVGEGAGGEAPAGEGAAGEGGGDGGTAGSGAGAGSVGSGVKLVAFTPDHAFINVGRVAANTAPPLTVTLSAPAQGDTVVVVTSNDPEHLSVANVTIPSGMTSALVPVTSLAQTNDVILSATLGLTLKKHVRVAGDAEPRNVSAVSPNPAFFPINGSRQLTVTLDVPALAGGAAVQLSLAPANAGTIPTMLTVAENQVAATFDFTDGGLFTGAIATATRGTSSASATLVRSVPCAASTLLISEVRTRGKGGARDEFVELYNPTDSPIHYDNFWGLIVRIGKTFDGARIQHGLALQDIPAHGHFLLTGPDSLLSGDQPLSGDIPDASSVELWHSDGVAIPSSLGPPAQLIDRVCYAYDDATKTQLQSKIACEGYAVANPHDTTSATDQDVSFERKPGGWPGNCTDSPDNASDFSLSAPATPQRIASPQTPPFSN